jgi:hypothetical protein
MELGADMGLLILVLSWSDDVAECRWGSGCMNPAVVWAAVSSTATVIVWKHCNFFVEILCFMIDFVFVFVFVFVYVSMVVLFMDDVCTTVVLMMCARVSFVYVICNDAIQLFYVSIGQVCYRYIMVLMR